MVVNQSKSSEPVVKTAELKQDVDTVPGTRSHLRKRGDFEGRSGLELGITLPDRVILSKAPTIANPKQEPNLF